MTRHIPTVLLALCLCGCFESRRSSWSDVSSYRPAATPNAATLPEGTLLYAKLQTTLDSGTRDLPATRKGTTFTATVVRADTAAVPYGTTVKGRVDDIQHIINRTSMRLVFYEIVLPDGRRAAITATPKSGSMVDTDEIKEGGTNVAKNFLIERGIDAITAGVLAPLWLAKKVVKGYDFVTKEDRMILPQGSTITIKLRTPAYIPRR